MNSPPTKVKWMDVADLKRWAAKTYIFLVFIAFAIWAFLSLGAIALHDPWIIGSFIILAVFASGIWLIDGL